MKTLLCTILFCWITIGIFAQCETKIDKDGLIYSEAAIGQMRTVVDSIHEVYQKSNLDKDYYSLPQTIGHYIQFDAQYGTSIGEAIKSGMDFDELVAVYGDSLWRVEKNLITTWKEYGKKNIVLSGFNFKTSSHHNIYLGKSSSRIKSLSNAGGEWMMSYNNTAFYFTKDFDTKKIPRKYARMIQYVDSMVDTTAVIYPNPRRKSNPFANGLDTLCDQYAFLRLIDEIKYPNKPKKVSPYPYAPYERYKDSLRIWECEKAEYILENIAPSASFQAALLAAYEEAIHEKVPTRDVERAIAFFYSKEKALEVKRSHSVYDYCGGDNSMISQRFKITQLAAETGTWEIFMRGHLSISYSQLIKMEGRKSYLKEVEALGVDTKNLLLGAALHAVNVHENHYHSSNSGNILAESSEPEALEQLMVKMITDKKLDAHNRMTICRIFGTYIEYLENENRKVIAKEKFRKALQKTPDYIRNRVGTIE